LAVLVYVAALSIVTIFMDDEEEKELEARTKKATKEYADKMKEEWKKMKEAQKQQELERLQKKWSPPQQ
jgi:uncharacterized membrane protein (DUF106 family)